MKLCLISPNVKSLQLASLILITILLLFLVNCNSVEPPNGLEINLKLEDVSCTEAWVTLTTTNFRLPASITLKQNNQVIKTINLNKTDSLLFIDSLLPNTSYQFEASNNQYKVTSNQLQLTTLDTTSHDFTWQTWTFGEHNSSVLFDCAIISLGNIWAVGAIYMNDSLGNPDNNAYNAIYWDGNDWELIRIQTNACGGVVYPPINTIFTFSADDILFAHIDGSISHYNGIEFINDCSLITQLNGSANKIWGISKNDYYVVSGNGFIAHYNGQSWQRIESGTEVNLTDIYGNPDGSEVWACGWNNSDGHTILLRINNNQSEIIYDSFNPNSLPYDGFISSLWTNGKLYFWLTGNSHGAIKHSLLDRNIAMKESFGLQYFPYRIRGVELNDISMSGAAAIVWHYNGYSWKQYNELLNLDDRVRSIDMKDGIVITVGLRYESILSNALIIVGRR